MNNLLSLLFLLFLGANFPLYTVVQQPSDRQDFLLRLRAEDGTPLANVTVSLIRVHDEAPMGTRTTDVNGEAFWSLPLGFEYEIVLPEDFRLSPELEQRVQHSGFGGLGFRLGLSGGKIISQPVIAGLVLAQNNGDATVFWDKSPNNAIPQPDIPVPEPTITDTDFPFGESISVTPDAASTETPQARSDTAWIFVFFGALFFLTAIIAIYFWLRPIIKG